MTAGRPEGVRIGPAVLVANAEAGSAAEEAVDEACDVLAAQCDIEVVWTGGEADLDAVIRRLDGRLLVVAGGDGSVSLVANRLMALEAGPVEVGLIPLGTGNDLARALRIPLDPGPAARALLASRPIPFDLLSLGDRFAVNAVHVGTGAEAARRAASLKPVLHGLAYPMGALIAGLGSRELDLEVVIDDEPPTRTAPIMVAMLNGMTVGGGTRMSTRQHVSDGRMGLSVIQPPTRWRRAGLAVDMARDRHLARRDVEHRTCSSIQLRSERSLLVNSDGEVFEAGEALTVSVASAALRMRVPVWGPE